MDAGLTSAPNRLTIVSRMDSSSEAPTTSLSRGFQASMMSSSLVLFMRGQLLLDLLDQTQGVIAGDERDVLVGADILKQLEQLPRIRNHVALQHRLHCFHQLRRIQWLILTRDRDIKNPDRLIRRLAILIHERLGILIVGPIKLRHSLALATLHPDP